MGRGDETECGQIESLNREMSQPKDSDLEKCRHQVSFFYSKTNEMRQFFKFILFCSSTLRVSDWLSVHHQESKTVHTACIRYMSNRFC